METVYLPTLEVSAELEAFGLTPKTGCRLHLLFAGGALRSRRADVRSHVCSAPLPAGSLLRVSPHALVCSPELTFLQLAEHYSPAKLIMAGCELCGTYVLDAESAPGSARTLPERPALTSADALAAFAEDAVSLMGRRAAQAAAVHVFDGAASPMEAKLALLLCLPLRMGGRNLPRPVLNREIPLTPEARRLYPRQSCRADLYWPDVGLDLEYDGAYHEDGHTHSRNVARTAALEAQGIDVLTVAYPQVADARSFTLIAEGVAARLGRRLRIRRDDFVLREAKLRADLQLC